MTDRELLELAAKAAGYDVKPHGNAKYSKDLHFIYESRNWNPLTDDGDALRLAVKLDMAVVSCMDDKEVGVTVLETALEIYEPHNDDPYAATRRAIVRAAAEIGRTM